IRYSQRTGCPVSRSNSVRSANRVPIGVANTTTRHPAARSIETRDGSPSGAGAPLITRYSTLRLGSDTCLPVFHAKFSVAPRIGTAWQQHAERDGVHNSAGPRNEDWVSLLTIFG